MPLRGLLAATLLVVTPGCRREQPQPSEAYTQAHTLFSRLYGEKGDDAFAEPSMADVEALLAQVPANSLDVQAAQELRARIEAGRTRLAVSEKERMQAVELARTPPSVPSTATAEEPPRPEQDESPADAGPTAPAFGTTVSELRQGFSGCFQTGEPLVVNDRGMRERWELKSSPECRQQYGALQDTLFIIEEGKVWGTAARSSIQTMTMDAGSPLPGMDGGQVP